MQETDPVHWPVFVIDVVTMLLFLCCSRGQSRSFILWPTLSTFIVHVILDMCCVLFITLIVDSSAPFSALLLSRIQFRGAYSVLHMAHTD